MSLNTTRMLLRSRVAARNHWICPQCRAAASGTAAPPTPLLGKLRNDLKTAMRQKDTNRLNVLRGVIADVTNAAKTSNPITTDMQLLALLRKKAAAAKTASAEFEAAGRQDLVQKEQSQVSVLDEYAGQVETVSEDSIRHAVTKVVAEAQAAAGSVKVNMGDVLRKILGPGGSLDGKTVDRSEVARLVKQTLGQ